MAAQGRWSAVGQAGGINYREGAMIRRTDVLTPREELWIATAFTMRWQFVYRGDLAVFSGLFLPSRPAHLALTVATIIYTVADLHIWSTS